VVQKEESKMKRFIELKWGSQLLVFTNKELHDLLAQDMDLWAEATRRGKAFKRARQRQERVEKKEVETWHFIRKP